MIAGLDILAVSGWLFLASNAQECALTKSPRISVNPVSEPIAYEFSLSSEELDQFKISTVNPYAPGTDASTGGLRHDKPVIEMNIGWGKTVNKTAGTVCFWYDQIDISIKLAPKIYIAKEKNNPVCRDEIIRHEIKHVDVDRKVINDYALKLGQAVQAAVNSVGALGPYNIHETEAVEARLVEHINSAVSSQELMLYQEMARQQAEIDTLEEYERVSKICNEAEKR